MLEDHICDFMWVHEKEYAQGDELGHLQCT